MEKKLKRKVSTCAPLEDSLDKVQQYACDASKPGNANVARALKSFRHEHKDDQGNPMTQGELVEYLNNHECVIASSTLRGFEDMSRKVSDRYIASLSSALGISENILRYGVEGDRTLVQRETGLDVKAIENLHRLKYSDYDDTNAPLVLSIINALLGNMYFLGDLGCAANDVICAFDNASTDLDSQIRGVDRDRNVIGALCVFSRYFENAMFDFGRAYSNYDHKAKAYMRTLRVEVAENAQESSQQ